MEVADPKKAEQLAPAAAPGFNMEDAEVEFAVAQAVKMAEQQAILESIFRMRPMWRLAGS